MLYSKRPLRRTQIEISALWVKRREPRMTPIGADYQLAHPRVSALSAVNFPMIAPASHTAGGWKRKEHQSALIKSSEDQHSRD
jgi:hypothetical protein